MGASMTAAELYETDDECKAFVAQWVVDRRCPPGFADYLHERGAGGAANAAWWAQQQPDRPYDEPTIHRYHAPGQPQHVTGVVYCGPFPRLTEGEWKWWGTFAGMVKYAYEYPGSFDLVSESAEQAIIDLLDSCKDREFDPAKDVGKGATIKGNV